MKKLGIIPLGIAVFTMFFGAGDIVFPLSLGKEVGGSIMYAILGFIATAVIVPILGFIATILFKGDYDQFFGTIGKIPATILIAFCMIIIGPLAASRCVIVSYAAMQSYIPFSLFIYTLIVGVLVFTLAVKENKVVSLIGRFFGPIKFVLLFSIVVLGIFLFTFFPSPKMTSLEGFSLGLKEGYFTLSLIGAFFFSHLIYKAIAEDNRSDLKNIAKKGVKAGIVGAILLAAIYTGFGFVSALHGSELINVPPERLLSALAENILGHYGAILANVAVMVATLTTAISLSTVFADYLCNDVFKKAIPYAYLLILTICINVLMENLQFAGLMKIIAPIAVLIYPSFIVLSVANICNKMFGFKYIKTSVVATFIATILFQYI